MINVERWAETLKASYSDENPIPENATQEQVQDYLERRDLWAWSELYDALWNEYHMIIMPTSDNRLKAHSWVIMRLGGIL